MGRATNNFTSWVGHAAEINTDRVSLPEKDLWIAVLTRAVLDACGGAPNLNLTNPSNVAHQNIYTNARDQARHFFLEGGSHFRIICELAGRNPNYIQERMRKMILRKKGWNVDVPITSHYRQGPRRGNKRGRPKKKKLTGNSYYAVIGKKGGRPRIYNVI